MSANSTTIKSYSTLRAAIREQKRSEVSRLPLGCPVEFGLQRKAAAAGRS